MVKKREIFAFSKPQLSIYGSVHHEKRKTRSANSALRASFASLELCNFDSYELKVEKCASSAAVGTWVVPAGVGRVGGASDPATTTALK